MTGEPEYYRHKIFEAAVSLNNEKNDDAKQILEMVFRFAEENDQEAKQILYDHFTKRVTPANKLNNVDTDCAWSIVVLDELQGFLFVVDRLGRFSLNDPQLKADSTLLLGILEDLMGEAEAAAALDHARQQNRYVDDYLKLVEGFRRKRDSRKHKLIKKYPYAKIKQLLMAGEDLHFELWSKFAPAEDLQQAALDLLQEDDPKCLSQYLRIFRRTPFPLPPDGLFKLTEHPEGRIWAMTFAVLENISHPSVREFALKRIQENKEVGRAIGLLNRNFQDGDWALIESIIQRKLEQDDHHQVQMSVCHIFEDHPDQAATATLINLYEYAPCSFCREAIIDHLHSMAALPDHIREECLNDSNLHIRELVENNFLQSAAIP